MNRRRCPTCYAEQDRPCRRLIVVAPGVVRWEDLPTRHPDRRP